MEKAKQILCYQVASLESAAMAERQDSKKYEMQLSADFADGRRF